MKSKYLILVSLVAFASPAFAGSPVTQPIAAPTQELYGLGWYGGFDAGVNVFQSYRNTEAFALNDGLGSVVNFNRQHKVGGFGGLKLGYVFGTGVFRPTIEEDIFFNGFQSSLRATVNNNPVVANSNVAVSSGAFMTNFIARFALGNGRFQPYVGAGIGGYYAETGNISVNYNNAQYPIHRSGSNGSFAWQAIVGSDYYVSPKISIFAEYKYLNYNNLGGGNNLPGVAPGSNSRVFGTTNLGQSLVGAGMRFHF